jgi:hypothetical protein
MHGVRGAVKWGYHIAAAVDDYTITVSPPPERRWTLAARLTTTNAFALGQTPLVFEAPVARSVFRFRITAIAVVGQSLTALLEPLHLQKG